jgi:hypothetical protein
MPEELRLAGGKSDGELVASENKEQALPVPDTGGVIERAESEKTPEETGEQKAHQLAEILSQARPSLGASSASGSATDDARNLSLLADVESQVTRLLDLAINKGIPHAVHVAEKMKSYYLLDRMHDEMIEKFYQGLAEKGLVKKA